MNVYNFWDRGLLGWRSTPTSRPPLRLRPLHLRPRARLGGAGAALGHAGRYSDPCPTPPGATGDGCVVSGRLSRLQAAGNVMTGAEQVLVEDWCQQYPSHSVGAVEFGRDGALYASGGDGASFNFVDYGQDGSPGQPLRRPARRRRARADPADGRGRRAAQPGPAHRRRPGQPRRHDHPGRPGHRRGRCRTTRSPPAPTRTPAGSSPTGCATRSASPSARHRRDLGRRRRLERLGGDQPHRRPADATVENFGWPCYEGPSPPAGLRRREPEHLREPVRQPGAVTAPYFAYHHSDKVVPSETCPTGSSVDRRAAFEFASARHLPGRVRRRAVLRRLLPRLHLGDAEGRGRPPRSRPDPHLRRRRGQPGQPADRAGRRPVLRRLRRRHDPPHPVLRGNQPPRPSPPPRRRRARRRSPSASTAPAPPTPTRATRSPTPGTSTATAPSTTRRPPRRRTPTRQRHATPPALRVTDSGGASDTDSVTITVGNTRADRHDQRTRRPAPPGRSAT